MKQERGFKGIWIPKEIWLSEQLTLQEKVFLVEIESLDNEQGCFASNDHFAKFFKLSKNRCSEIIKSLQKKGLITINYQYQKESKAIEKRVIKCIREIDGGIRNIDRPIRKVEEGYSENCEDNNTVFNNTTNNTSRRKDIVVQSTTPSQTDQLVDAVITYLNQKTGKNFSLTGKENRRFISARIKEGATPEQLRYVIDVKCAEWLNHDTMCEYLRPKTLFNATNFENYINQSMPVQKQTTLNDLIRCGQLDVRDVL